MRKFLVVLGLMAVLSPVFGQEEYTLYYSGDIQGLVTIQKDRGGKITITPKLKDEYGNGTSIDHAICSLIPERKAFSFSNSTGFTIDSYTTSIIIDGNTTTETNKYNWTKTVVDGNTITATTSYGNWTKTVITGNTTMVTDSNGWWAKKVVDGNTTMMTTSVGWWSKTVVDGNTTMFTHSNGDWEKTVVTGTTMMFTKMFTARGDRWQKTVVDKQGNNIFITEEFDGTWGR